VFRAQQSAAAMETALSTGASWGMQEDAIEDPEEGAQPLIVAVLHAANGSGLNM